MNRIKSNDLDNKNRIDDFMFKYLSYFILIFFLVVLFRNAWMGDDAFITMRTVDNFINGYGLRWNIIERVQSYTHPLWMFCISAFYFFIRHPFYVPVLLNIIISTITFWLITIKFSKNYLYSLIAASILIFSKAFIDYSTSGLENPLTHLLIVIFAFYFFKFYENLSHKRLFFLYLIATLGMLNRVDNILFFLPALMLLIAKKPLSYKKFLYIFYGCIPLIVWESFTLFYYGFLFPNTFYAKLSTGIPAFSLVEQGYNYFLNSISWDPLTLTVIFSIVAYYIFIFKKNLAHSVIALGILFYLIYIIKIGGDFMSGRFFTAPLIASIMLMSQMEFRSRYNATILLSIIVLLGFHAIKPTIVSDSNIYNYNLVDAKGIADEKEWYYSGTGLLTTNRYIALPSHFLRIDGDKAKKGLYDKMSKDNIVADAMAIGMFGVYAGKEVNIIDQYGLSDAFLARLPSDPQNWRIGHFARQIPEGYKASFNGNGNYIANEYLKTYWQHLSLVIRGDLFNWERIKEIIKFNTGQYDRLLDQASK